MPTATPMLRPIAILTVLALTGVWITAQYANAHCQVPCGIYDDAARIAQLEEDGTTLTKAMNQMAELADKNDVQSKQQFARWVAVKEQHASHIITVVSEYFLTQKLKPVAPDAEGYEAYLAKLATHHRVMVAAMKCKQNADPAYAQALSDAVHELGHLWAPPHH